MTDDFSGIGIGPARDRLEQLSRRADALPADARDLVHEILEAFAISAEELQVAAEELHQQNEELLAAREELESQRSRYRDLFEFAPNGYLVTDPAGVIQDANQAAVKVLGAPKSELVGKPLVVYVKRGEWERYHVFVERVTGVQPAGEFELVIGLQPRRGPTFPAALTVASVRDAQGELTGLRWLLRDMTASKQAAERERLLGEIQGLMVGLEQERQTLQTIMENTPAQLALLDPEFNFVRVNAAYAEGAGHSREELIGRNHFEIFPNPENQAIFEGVRDIGEPVAYQARPFEYADQPERGVTYWDWTLVPVKDEAGMSQGLVISLAEVTEQVQARQERERLLAEAREQRRQAQQASRETEAANRLLQALIETMPIGVVVADKDGTLGTTNAAAQAILGSSVTGDVSHPERTYTPHHPDGALFRAQNMPLMHALTDGKDVHDVEILIRRADSSECTVLASAAPVRDESGETVSALVVFQDITERKRAREALQGERDRLAALINSIRDEVWFADAEGRFTLVNPSGSRTFALEADAITDARQLASSLQVLRPDGTLRPIEEAPPLRALRGEVVTDQEELVRTPATGELRHRQVSAAPVRDGSGNIIGSVSVVHDITALKEVEAERERLLAENRRQRAFLERLIEAAPVGLAVVRGPDHRYELVNPRYQAIPSMPDAPMVGHTLAQVLPDVAVQGALEMVGRAYQTGQTVSAHEYEASVGPGREETYWDVDHVPLRGPDGAVDGVLILADEVTDQVLARRHVQDLAESLARERDVLQTIMENTRTQLAYLDPQFRFVLVNSAYAQGSGHSSEELIGHQYFDLFPDPENQAIFQRVRDTGEPVEFLAKPFEFADQPERGVTYWDWTLVPVKDRDGQVLGLVLSLMDVTDMQRLLMALGAERARLRAIIENAPEAIVVADKACRLVLANPAADRLYAQPVPYGQDLDSQAGLALRSANGALYDHHDLPLTRSVRDGETVRNLEMTIRQPDGHMRDLLVSTAPIQDEQGDVAGAVGVFQDITERRRTQRALQRYAERLRILHETDQAILAARSVEEIAEAALNHVQQLIPCLRASVILFDVEKNQASVLAVRTKGETRKAKGWRGPIGSAWGVETLAHGQIHIVEEIQALPSSAAWLEILQDEGVHSYLNVPLLARDTLFGSLNLGMASAGSPGPEELEIAREMAAQLAIGIEQARLQEQLERHAGELERRVARRTAALQASQARLQAIFDGAAIGIALADAGGRILESNSALQAMLGYTADELRAMVFTDFTHPEDVTADMDLFRELLAGSRTEYSLDKRYMRKDGQVVWAKLTVSLVRSREDEAPLAIGMVEDITEQKEIQDALLRTEKLAIAGQLGASLAHEINNPMQSVIGCLGLAEKNLGEGEGVRRYLRVAREELRRAADIVAQLRDLHRLSEPEEKKATDLNQLLEEVLLLCRKKCEECGIELGWDAAEDLPSILLVPGQMRQVFLNLILNALDATPEGGRLEVSTARTAATEAAPAGVRISVADSGSGITSDVLPHVFDPFYTTKPQGLGLGLYITHKIIEAHGGRIDVSSRSGEGTVFSVWLPE